MCSAPNVYMFVYILIGTHMVPLSFLFQWGDCSGPSLSHELCCPNLRNGN